MPPHHHHGGHARGFGPGGWWPYTTIMPIPVGPTCETMNDQEDATKQILLAAKPRAELGRCPSCGKLSGVALTNAGACSEILCSWERRWFPASQWTERTMNGADLGGRVGVAPATVTMLVPRSGMPTLMGADYSTPEPQPVVPGWRNGYPVAPGVPAVPDVFATAPYYGYFRAVKGWITPGLGDGTGQGGLGETIASLAEPGLAEFPLGDLTPTAGQALGVVLLGGLVGGLVSGLIAFAAFKASGAKHAVAPALIFGGGSFLASTAGALAMGAVRK